MRMSTTPLNRQTNAKVYRLATFEDAYTKCFHEELLRVGVNAKAGNWGIRWLIGRVCKGDIVHLHWPSALYHEESLLRTWRGVIHVAAGLVMLRIRGVRVVWTAHNLYPHDGGKDLLAHRVVRRLVVKYSCRICVHGRAAGEMVRREFGVSREKIVILEHGNWIGHYPNTIPRAVARNRLRIEESSFMFLFVGLCRPYKNLEYLVRSHADLNDDSVLWIVGRFPSNTYYSAVRKSTDARNDGRVEIRNGFVSDDELQVYLNACDVVVIPYREVLTSGSVMLALSFGRPIIAPNIGALAEVVTEECGVLYDPSCEDGLHKAMLSARSRRFRCEAILERARCFSWRRSAEIYATEVVNCSR